MPKRSLISWVKRFTICTAIVGGLVASNTAMAQNGDKKDGNGEVQIDPIPLDKIPPSPILSPEDALKSFKLAPGFHIELVAAEPLVHDPVAMSFDPEGRIWVVEMSGYMPNADGIGEDKKVGKVVVLEDTDGDGKMDKRTVFVDGLVMPRALSLVQSGVLVAEPPHLWLFKDTDHDGKADEKTEVAKDYGSTVSPEHTANGLIWGLDNWIYSADHTTRFHEMPEDDFKREPTAFRGQYGISQDDFGRLVYNSNSDQYRMDLVPSQYLIRNPNYRTPAGLNVDPIHNQTTWPIRMTPGVNRGYRKGTLRPDGTLTAFTAACSPLIYRGDNFPAEFEGNAFVCEPSANLVKRNVLVEKNGSITGYQAYTNAEFLASTDEWFRPVSLSNGPDGAMYVVDLHHGILQHRIFLTSYLRHQSEARGLEKAPNLGRIYRIVSDKNPLPKAAKLSRVSADLVKELSSPNGWRRDTAQRLLVERDDVSVIPALRSLAMTGQNPLGRLHALWTLAGMSSGLDEATLLKALQDKHTKVKAVAIRLCEPFIKKASGHKLLVELLKMVNDGEHDIQLQLAFTLGEVTDPIAEGGMSIIAKNSTRDVYVRDALLTGLYKRELEFLEKLLAQKNAWTTKNPGNDLFFSGLAQCILAERKTNRVNQLFGIAASGTDWQRVALLNGIAGTTSSGKNAPKPKLLRFTSEPGAWKQLSSLKDKETAASMKKIGQLITWPGRPGYTPPPVIRAMTAEEKKRFDVGHEIFSTTCAACHQATGLGMEGLAPPLADSEWVLGPEKRVARILLNGLHGPVKVAGKKFDLDMPSFAAFDDQQIAGLLTYIRREWENTADPVTPETIAHVRTETAKRAEAWTEPELLKVQ